MKKYLLFTMVAATMVSCAPKVTSEMLTNDFQAQPTNKVMIYGPKDNVPETAKAIGQVTIDGKKTSLREQYARAIDLAVTEAAHKGGNVLVVDNRELKENRLKGTIAYTNDKIIDSLTLSANRVKQLQHMPISRKPADVKQMGDKEQQEIAQQQETAKAAEEERLKPVYLKRDSIYNADPEAYEAMERERELQAELMQKEEMYSGNSTKEKDPLGSMFKLSIGPAWTTSDTDDSGSFKLGYALSLSFTNKGYKAYGFGGDFYFSYADVERTSFFNGPSYTLLYAGPCFVIGGDLDSRLSIDASFGLGLAYSLYGDNSEFGYGGRISLGLEYKVSETAGVGIDLLRPFANVSRPENIKQLDGFDGIRQFCLMLSGRFHF